MSAIQTVQIGSIPFKPQMAFSASQKLGNTTNFTALQTSLGKPIAVAGSDSVNPVAVFDNRVLRATSILIMFAGKAASNAYLAFDLMGFSEVLGLGSAPTGCYLPTRMFNGVAQLGNIALTALESGLLLADNFSTKTFESDFVSYIEPADDIGGAVLLCDMRGFDFMQIRFAQGGSTAATYAQAFIGIN